MKAWMSWRSPAMSTSRVLDLDVPPGPGGGTGPASPTAAPLFCTELTKRTNGTFDAMVNDYNQKRGVMVSAGDGLFVHGGSTKLLNSQFPPEESSSTR